MSHKCSDGTVTTSGNENLKSWGITSHRAYWMQRTSERHNRVAASFCCAIENASLFSRLARARHRRPYPPCSGGDNRENHPGSSGRCERKVEPKQHWTELIGQSRRSEKASPSLSSTMERMGPVAFRRLTGPFAQSRRWTDSLMYDPQTKDMKCGCSSRQSLRLPWASLPNTNGPIALVASESNLSATPCAADNVHARADSHRVVQEGLTYRSSFKVRRVSIRSTQRCGFCSM